MASRIVRAMAVQFITGEIERYTQPVDHTIDLGNCTIAHHYGNTVPEARSVISLRPRSANQDSFRSADIARGIVMIYAKDTKEQLFAGNKVAVAKAFNAPRRSPCVAFTPPTNRASAPHPTAAQAPRHVVTRRSTEGRGR